LIVYIRFLYLFILSLVREVFNLKLIAVGAEAKIYFDEKSNTIVKDRVSKGYRVKEFDEKVRRIRTKKEIKMLNDSKRAGVFVPNVISKTDYVIVMEFVDGVKVKDYVNLDNYLNLGKIIGSSVGKLHKFGLIHGDLTTSNMIYKDEKVYFIDFGLGVHSLKIEDMAVDLHLLEQAVESTHFDICEKMLECIFESYCLEFDNGSEVVNRLDLIRKRGRYNKRESDVKK
jgi:TP53 regulating kinase and related kinases